MSALYKELAQVYEAMYHTFMDYPAEYQFYSSIFKQYQKKNLLEIGSGTGKLAALFQEHGFQYIGMDLSPEMIAIAQKKVPELRFLEGNMCTFRLARAVDGILIPGRTISYLRHNEELKATFSRSYENLEKGGILCFDFIDAQRFLPTIAKGKNIEHQATYQGVDYLRKSEWSMHLEQGMGFKWLAHYYKKTNGALVPLGEDHSIVRTFLKEELVLLLQICGFEIKAILDKVSYAFPTYVIVAQRL